MHGVYYYTDEGHRVELPDIIYNQAIEATVSAQELLVNEDGEFYQRKDSVELLLQTFLQMIKIHSSQGDHLKDAKECFEDLMLFILDVKYSNREKISNIERQYASLLMQMGEFSEASLLFQHAIDSHRHAKGKEDLFDRKISRLMLNKGIAMLEERMFDEAQVCFEYTLDFLNNVSDNELLAAAKGEDDWDWSDLSFGLEEDKARCYSSIAAIHYQFLEFDESQESSFKAIEVYKGADMRNSMGMVYTLCNLAILFEDTVTMLPIRYHDIKHIRLST